MFIEKAAMIISFLGVAVIITGKDTTSASITDYPIFAIVALLLNPVLNSLVTIALRTSKGLSLHT
jgi:hypothetical protein